MNNLNRLFAASLILAAAPLGAQEAPSSSAAVEDDVIELSPFEVAAEADGYAAATTLAGNRLNTELRDIGSAVTVITSQFLQDIGATSNESLLQYTIGTEVGNIGGNFTGVGDGATLDESDRFRNPNQNTRVRGLAAADNARNYFLSDIPWDGYNVDRVELQRGPNSILFGQGSPAGLINTGTRQAAFRNSGEVSLRFDDHSSVRVTGDINRVLLPNELALRFSFLQEEEKFQQKPAFEDDTRYYAALRYEPRFLNRSSARTIIRANFESGDIESNRPRTLPPIDLITPWFRTGTYEGVWSGNGTFRDPATGEVVTVTQGSPRTFANLNRATFNPHQLQDDNTGRSNSGQMRPGINGGVDSGRFNPSFNPWIGNFGQQFGGPNAFFGGEGDPNYWLWEIRTTRGIGPDGEVDNGIGGFAFHRPGGVAQYSVFARNAGLPFSQFGVYKNFNLTDASVFDFYNNLLDGPNKEEYQNFETYNFSISQTFMNDKFGIDYSYNREEYENGQIALLAGDRQAIYIDFMSVYSDGTPDGLNGVPHQDGTPNPNVGRPFISDSGQGGNNSYDSERISHRATAFLRHDFNPDRRGGWLRQLLGRHTLTGLYSEDEQETENRSWARYSVLNSSYHDLFELPPNTKFNSNELSINRVIYLGPSLLDRPSASGVNIPRPAGVFNAPSGTIRFFDSTWANPAGVNPADPWINNYFVEGDERRDSTQSENPDNYIGWIDAPLEVTDSEASAADRERLTTAARLTRSKVESKAIVLQSHFWNNAFVGTFGYREDTASSWEFSRTSQNSPGFGYIDFGPTYRLADEPDTMLDVTSRSYSLVAHLDQVPFIGRLTEKLPVSVSLLYNKSDNFQPAANRVDIYGESIAAPAGSTTDQGILIESRNGRFSFKVNKYRTELTNATSTALNGTWFIGASQAWSGQWTNIFEFNLSGEVGSTADGPNPGRYTYGPAPGETQADADAREAAAIAAWRTWQASVDPRFYAAWQVDTTGNNLTQAVSSTVPPGFSVTEDSVSEGYEFELTAQPTRNWRVTLNASKTEARRQNIGGANLANFVADYENFLKNEGGGDLRIWWGGAGNETALFQWNNNIGSEWAARKLQEGTNVPELREWRFNAITNYDFQEGRLKGVNVGGALRWQDSVIIGYPPEAVPNDPTSVSFDLDNPYKGPSEANVDLWFGYGRKLRGGVEWQIQFNVRNLGEGNGLIPITTQPDGTAAGYRIAPRQTWTVTNTFRF